MRPAPPAPRHTGALPVAAQAQQKFAVSCDNVTAIRIRSVTAKEPPIGIRDYNGQFFLMTLSLTPEAIEALQALVAATPWESVPHEGGMVSVQDIRVTANGGLLKTDSPAFRMFGMKSITLLYAREQEALDAARLVCPSLTPERFSNELPGK